MNTNVNEVKIKIIEVKEVKTVDGRKFNAYKSMAKNGDKMDVKFTQECTLLPKEPCTIVVNPVMANVSTKKVYPVLWVKEVLRIEKTERQTNVLDYFGEEAPDFDDSDVPPLPSESEIVL